MKLILTYVYETWNDLPDRDSFFESVETLLRYDEVVLDNLTLIDAEEVE